MSVHAADKVEFEMLIDSHCADQDQRRRALASAVLRGQLIYLGRPTAPRCSP